MHLMVSAWIPKHEIEELWYYATDRTAYIVRQRDHGIHSPAGYLSKYLQKGFRDAPFDKNERRYGFSSGDFPKLPGNTDSWVFIPYNVQYPHAAPDPVGTVMYYSDRADLEDLRRWYPNYEWVYGPEKTLDPTYPSC